MIKRLFALAGASSGHTKQHPKKRPKCCSKFIEMLQTLVLMAIGMSVFFSLYNSSKLIYPANAPEENPQPLAPKLNVQEAAQRRQEALQKLEKEAAEFDQDDQNKNSVSGGQQRDNNMKEDSNSAFNMQEEEDTSQYFVQPDDFIYQNLPGEAAPIVVEKYKLIFFTVPKVGCTVWKMLFRRMMGYSNWQSHELGMPHTPEKNGLAYLYHYNLSYASEIMTSPEWTRAIFLRDPKERFLSAYLDKAVEEPMFWDTCCNWKRQIYCNVDPPSLPAFLSAIHTCKDSHWNPQTERMESKYWPYINFVGQLENAEKDSKKLLQQLNAWEDYGANGWGARGEFPIFHSENKDGLKHANNAKDKTKELLYPEIEQEIEKFYDSDYNHPPFNFSHSKRYKDPSSITAVDHASLDLPYVEPRDYIIRNPRDVEDESSPIVIEEYKLVFFAVPHVARGEFKRLFHRMMGHGDWKQMKVSKKKPSALNKGLVFLRDYNLTAASEIMTSPEWTRAIFLREPKERFVVAYTETATLNRLHLHRICCRNPKVFCVRASSTGQPIMDVPDLPAFVNGIKKCKSTHWDPFVERLEALRRTSVNSFQKKAIEEHSFDDGKYWKYINYIGHMDHAYEDAKSLLTRIGAWEKFGASGWATEPSDAGSEHDAFFNTREFLNTEIKYKELVRTFIKDPQLEGQIDKFYEGDYNSRWLNLTKKIIIPTSVKDLANAAQDIRFALNKDEETQDTKTVQRQW